LGTISNFRDNSLDKRLFVCDRTPEFMALVKNNEGQISWAENDDGLLDVVPAGNVRTV